MLAGRCLLAVLLCCQLSVLEGAPAPLDSSRIKHPLLQNAHLFGGDEHAYKRARLVMGWPLKRFDELIDNKGLHWTPHWLFPCPACGKFVDHRRVVYTVEKPEALGCVCGTDFSHEKYPISGYTEYTNALGEKVKFPYHLTKNGHKFCFESMKKRCLYFYLRAALEGLCHLHRTKKDAEGQKAGEYAVYILNRFAEAYPHWANINGEARRQPRLRKGRRPFHVLAGARRWDESYTELPLGIIRVYDAIYNSEEWHKLSKIKGYDTKLNVENNLLRMVARILRASDDDGGVGLGNLKGSDHERYYMIGKVLNDPELMHYTMRDMRNYISYFYYCDGTALEGTATYHSTVTNRTLRAQRAGTGYKDLIHEYPPVNQSEFIASTWLTNEMPVYRRAINFFAADVWRYPYGDLLPVHDHWYPGRRAVNADKEANNVERNAYGHFALGRGKGKNATQVHLHFCPVMSMTHYHDDRLNMILFGANEELLPDLGYIRTGGPGRFRSFAGCRNNHNTVTIYHDPKERREAPPVPPRLFSHFEDTPTEMRLQAVNSRDRNWARSTILGYDAGLTSGKRVQLISAASPGPAWHKVKRNQRSLLLVAVDDERSFVVDNFHVEGGSRHLFALRPSLNQDVTEKFSLKVEKKMKELGALGKAWGISWQDNFKDVLLAKGDQPWTLEWTGEDPPLPKEAKLPALDSTGHKRGATVRCFFDKNDDADVMFAQSFTLRRAGGGAGQDFTLMDKFYGPHLFIHRTGETGLKSEFSVIYEPVNGDQEGLIEEVNFLISDTERGVSAVEVKTAERTILVYTSLDHESRKVRDYACQGLHAVLSLQAGAPEWAWAYDASISGPGVAVQSRRTSFGEFEPARKEGGRDFNGFVIRPRPGVSADQMENLWVRARYGDVAEGLIYAHRVAKIEHLPRYDEKGDAVKIEIDGDPGFDQTKGEVSMAYYPWYTVRAKKSELDLVKSTYWAKQ